MITISEIQFLEDGRGEEDYEIEVLLRQATAHSGELKNIKKKAENLQIKQML
jgi:hypothetical protein